MRLDELFDNTESKTVRVRGKINGKILRKDTSADLQIISPKSKKKSLA